MPTARCPVPGAHEHPTVLLPRRTWAAFSTIRRPSVMAAHVPRHGGGPDGLLKLVEALRLPLS